MAKKNSKPDYEPKFVVKKRVPKEKPNFFQNIPDIKSRLQHPHPLAEAFEIPTPEIASEASLDSQKNQTLEHLDSQSNRTNISKTEKTSYPSRDILAIQKSSDSYPASRFLDSQNQELGHPTEEVLDSNIAKDPILLSKSEESLDSKIAAQNSLDSQSSEKKGKWKKYDKKRSTASVFIRADEELINQVKHFNVERKLDMREFFELSARNFIDSFGYPKKDGLDSNIALDDRRMMIMFKTKPDIINLFREYNRILTPNSEWKPKDDAVGVKYNELDLKIVEIGIITTQTNILESDSGTQVSRFKYYTPEIDKLAAVGFTSETLNVMIQTYRKRWRELTNKELDLSFLDKEGKP